MRSLSPLTPRRSATISLSLGPVSLPQVIDHGTPRSIVTCRRSGSVWAPPDPCESTCYRSRNRYTDQYEQRYGTPRNLSIPVDAFSNGQGTLTTQLALPENQEFLITMSDSTGFGSGGTSPLLTVGPPVSGTNCNTTDPGTSFTFSLPNALQQCR